MKLEKTSTVSFPPILGGKELRNLGHILTLLLFIKLAGYFTISENIAITQGAKIALRMTATTWIWFLMARLQQKGHVFSFKLQYRVPVAFYMAYLLLGFISFLWSTDPGYSALQWTMDVESFVFAFLFMRVYFLLRKWYPEQFLSFGKMMSKAIFAISIIFLAGMSLAPDQFYRMTHGGEVARLGGNLMNPNELGMLSVIGCALLFPAIHKGPGRSKAIFMALVMFVTVLATGSRSSLSGFFLVGIWYIWTKGNAWHRGLSIVVAALAIPLVVNYIFIKQGDVEEVMSMTGRLPFWTALLNEGLPESPWVGFGFMRIAWTDTFQSVHTYAGHMTHNTFIQVLMNLGLVGFGLCMTSLISLLVARRRNRSHKDAFAFTAILIPVLINSCSEFGIFGETNFDILIYQLLLFLFIFRWNPSLSLREGLKIKRAKICLT